MKLLPFNKLEEWPYGAVFVLIFMLLLAAYSNSFTNGFVYDDGEFIVNNRYIKNLSYLPDYFTDVQTQSATVTFSHYRPLTTLSFALNFSAAGLNPWPYHLTNFIFHFFAAMLFFHLIDYTFNNRLMALAAALFWGLTPLQSEAVSWISGRSNVMSAAFYLLALNAYVHWRTHRDQPGWLLLLFVSFAAALLSKESALTLPLMLLGYDWCSEEKIRPAWRVYAGLLIVGGVFWLVRTSVVGGLAMPLTWSSDPLTIASTMIRVMGRYFRLLLLPAGLHIDYDFPLSYTLFRVDVLLLLGLLTALGYAIYYFRQRQVIVSLALLFFVIHILPVANIIPFQVIMAERFLYLPSLGFALLLAFLITLVPRQSVRYALIAVISLTYLGLTFKQNQVWFNENTLWSQVLKYEPQNAKAHYGVGNYYLSINDLQQANESYQKSVTHDDTSYLAFNNLGVTYKLMGQYDLAIQNFNKALSYKQGLEPAALNLADIYAMKRDFKAVTTTLEQYVEIVNTNPQVYYRLALAYVELGDKTKARAAVNTYAKLLPNDPALPFLQQITKAKSKDKTF